MFGRSGQMFPRQRAYHDAMYEEEYSTDDDDDCCRGRGAAGILCWFFSVILLIGLAASVILTAFFLLKSRNSIGNSGSGSMSTSNEILDDLDLFYGFNRNFDNKSDTKEAGFSTQKTILSTEVAFDLAPDMDFTYSKESSQVVDSILTKNGISTLSPTRRRTYDKTLMSHNFHTTSTSPPTIRTVKNTAIPPVTMTTEGPYLLTDKYGVMSTATVPPNTFPRRISTLATMDHLPGIHLPETIRRGSDERWRPIHAEGPNSSLDETLSTTTTRAHVLFSMPPSSQQSNSDGRRRRPNRGPVHSSFTPSTEKQSDETVESGMVPDPTPPTTTSTTTVATTTVATTTTSAAPTTATPSTGARGNLLHRIISNLAPKFKNKTEIFSSQEKFVPVNPNFRVKTTIRTRTTSPASITEAASNMEVVEPPKVTDPLPATNFTSIDILVSGDDQKRLLTKQTESGVVTSAIFPSWYLNDTVTEESVTLGDLAATVVNTTVAAPTPTYSAGLGQFLLNMFDPPSTEPPSAEQPNRLGNIGLNPTPFKDLLKEFSPVLPSSSLAPIVVVEDGGGGDDGYDQESDEASEETELDEDDGQPSPSHVIEVAFDTKETPKIIIDSAPAQTLRTYTASAPIDRQPLKAASEVHPQVVSAPANFDPTATTPVPTAHAGADDDVSQFLQQTQYQTTATHQHKPMPPLNGFQHEDDHNYFFERQPVSQLDENLYFQIPPPATKPFPIRLHHSAETHLHDGADAMVQVLPPNSAPLSNNTGFVTPLLMDFHSNKYDFNPPNSSSGFMPVTNDAWRPVLPKEPPPVQRPKPSSTHPPKSILPTYEDAVKLRHTTIPSKEQSVETQLQTHWPPAGKMQLVPSPPILSPPLHGGGPGRVKFPTGNDQDMSAVNHAMAIDRTKYMRRPPVAPPPTGLRRRNPLLNLLPNRRQSFRNQPFPNQHQLIQHQRLAQERLYQQHFNRQRQMEGGGQIQWPNEDGGRTNG